MSISSKPEKISHASGIRQQLQTESGLPFSEILSAETIHAAVMKHTKKWRMRFFFAGTDFVDVSFASSQ